MDILFLEENELRAVVFDATLKFVPTSTTRVTEHPVEGGTAITDHTIVENDRLTAECFVTNKPTQSPNFDGANGSRGSVSLTGRDRKQTKAAKVSESGTVQGAEYSNQDKDATGQVLKFGAPFDRRLSVYETLRRICALGLECSIGTSLGIFDSMLITNVSAPIEAKGSVTFTIDAQAIRVVSSELVEVEPLESRAERARRLGARDTEDPSGEETVSLAAQALEAFTDIDLIHEPRRSGVGIFTR
jgi:hypothetical protein